MNHSNPSLTVYIVFGVWSTIALGGIVMGWFTAAPGQPSMALAL